MGGIVLNSHSVVFNIDSTIYSLNGQIKIMDVSPFVKEGRSYVPLRYILNPLGVEDKDITFMNNQLVIDYQGNQLSLEVGSNTMLFNGIAKSMDVAPVLVEERMMLPARYVAEALGAKVAFEEGKIIINLEF